MFPGRTIADRYRVLRVLGRGGMGVVSEVEAIDSGQRFAIKFLRDDVESDVQPNARFVREAKLATRLRSPHTCRVSEIGEWELGPYLVMELLEGRSLSAILEDRSAITWQQVVRIAYEMCDALGEAHQRGIVHRDVKPGNVFIAKAPERGATTKMLDFGVAKIPVSVVTAHGDRSLTDASTLLGTPSYVAPEQLMNSKLVDARADVWAVGILLYEMLGGRLPFSSPLVPKLLVMIAREEPAPLSTLAPDIPSELVAIVHRCLRKKPEERFDDAQALAQALAPWLDRSPELLDPLLVLPSRQKSVGPSGPPATLPPLCEATQAAPSSRKDARQTKPQSSGELRPESAGSFGTALVEGRPPETIARRRSFRMRCVLLGSAAGVLAGIVYLVMGAQPPVPTPPSESAPGASSPAAPQPVPQHSVLVLVDPAQARIEFDSLPLSSNPAHLTGPDDGTHHRLVISAPGHRTETRTVRFDRDQQLSLSLTKETAQAASSARAAAPEPSPTRPRATTRAQAVPSTAAPKTRHIDTENPF